MSTRGTILNTLGTQLLTITTANGYTQTISHVYRELPSAENHEGTGLDITILDGGGDSPMQYADSSNQVAEMTVELVVDVWGSQRTEPTDGTHPVATAIDNAIGDIRELVNQISLGANVRFAELGDFASVPVSTRQRRFSVPLSINYYFDASAP